MITRLTDYVEYGLIDNHERDVVKVRLKLVGERTPVQFILEGNCHKDIAGCTIEFKPDESRKKSLSHDSPVGLRGVIKGIAGDITASRRVGGLRKGMPLSNMIYIEIIVDGLGLLVLEGKYDLVHVSPYEWMMDDCDEQALIMCNQQVMRDYVQSWIKRFASTREDKDPLPDHRWDLRLREAEGVAIAYQEVHYKYRNTPCGDTCEAFILGWDEMLGELADSDENGTSFASRISGALSLFDILTDEEAIDAQLSMSHPIFQQVIAITETAQKLFARQINDLQVRHKAPSAELGVLFQSIRYVTPNILSCLLQMNEGTTELRVLAARLERCAVQVDQAIAELHELQIDGIREFLDMLAIFSHDVLEMRSDLLNQQGTL